MPGRMCERTAQRGRRVVEPPERRQRVAEIVERGGELERIRAVELDRVREPLARDLEVAAMRGHDTAIHREFRFEPSIVADALDRRRGLRRDLVAALGIFELVADDVDELRPRLRGRRIVTPCFGGERGIAQRGLGGAWIAGLVGAVTGEQ